MDILAFNGSPRNNGNSSLLLKEFLRGAGDAGHRTEELVATELHLTHCQGCLKCNLLKRCAIQNDDWRIISTKVLKADVIVISSPIYFHHMPAPLKLILDRFRSFIDVRITVKGLQHTPWHKWKKRFVLLLCCGSSNSADAQPVIDLFTFMTAELGPQNSLHSLVGTRLAVRKQVQMTERELEGLYSKLGLPVHLAEQDCKRNRQLLKDSYELGRNIGA
jgi:NAD(P)H-dependent FMN reductase